jgi:hypothetical protein
MKCQTGKEVLFFLDSWGPTVKLARGQFLSFFKYNSTRVFLLNSSLGNPDEPAEH